MDNILPNIATQFQDLITKQLQDLETHINEVEKENTELKIKLGKCEGMLETFQLFYSDFKHLNKTVVIPVDNIQSEEINFTPKTIPTIPNYDVLLGEYFVNGNVDILKHLFEDYGVTPSQILTDIRDKLPINIVDLVKQYKCKNEYKIISKSIRNIKRFTKNNRFPYRGIMDLVTQYINNYNKENKDIALKFLKQTLVYFPFQFDKFLDNIKEYKYDDLSEIIENLKIELYGKNNMLLIKKNNIVKKIENNIVLIDKNHKKERGERIDYKNASISELVENIKNVKFNPSQRARLVFDYMQKAKRTNDDCLLFKEEVNKILHKNI